MLEGWVVDGISRVGWWQYTGGDGRVDWFCCLSGSGAEGEVSLTGGPHLDPVVLMRLADDILGPDAEAVIPRVPEDVGQVVSCVGHGHWVTFPFLQRKALVLETPAHSQRGAARK